MEKLDEARISGDRSAQLFEQLANEDPNNVEAQEARADSIYSQGFVLEKSKDVVRAMQHYEAAVAVYDDLIAKHPENVSSGLRTACQLIASLSLDTGDVAKAQRYAQRELDIDEQLLKRDFKNVGARRNQGVAYMQIGRGHELLAARASAPKRMAEWREGRTWYERSAQIWQDLQKNGTLVPAYAKKPDEAAAGIARCDRGLAARHSD
jgi:tetratricopeptide (TPR) repeat protein